MGLRNIAFLGALLAFAWQEDRLYFPEGVEHPDWLDSRMKVQIESARDIGVFHDFRFRDGVEESGITFRNRMTEDSGLHHKAVHYDHGNGIAAADVDSDGKIDLYFTNQVGGNGLWRSLGGGRFEDVTERAGVALAGRISVAASFGDIDNDADPDLYVTTVRHGNVLFENDGTGRFRDVSRESGTDYSGHSSASVFFDYDRDGLLDLYLSNVGVYTTDQRGPGGYYVGVLDAFGGHLKPERDESSILYRNLGGRRFQDVTEEAGLKDDAWTGDASPMDLNEDGFPDLYVLNMQGHDQYYENQGGKYFSRKTRVMFPRTPWGSMGIGAFDFDNDGDLDVMVTDMHSDMSEEVGPEREKLKSRMVWDERFLRSGGNAIYGNAFYRNDGKGKLTEISDEIGAENYWPWGFSVADVNADGYEDVFITSGMGYPLRYGVNTLLLNDGGRKFRDSEFLLGVEPRRGGRVTGLSFVLDASGADEKHPLVEPFGLKGTVEVWSSLSSRASVLFDLDDDGDVDIVTNEFNDGPMVLVSDLSERKTLRFLKIELLGSSSNRSGIGARVVVRASGREYTRVNDGKSGYLSQSDLPLYFGLAEAETVDRIRVFWPTGKEQTLEGPLEINRLLEIQEPAALPE
jgi:hypothetical protein